MTNPLHDLYIQAEQPENHNSLMNVLGSLSSRYEFISVLHEEKDRVFSKFRDLASGRDVVIVQLQSDTENDIRTFFEEMNLSSKLQHPGIVPVYDAGENKKGPFFVRKWIDDKPLSQRISDGLKIWKKDQVLRIFLQLCEALNYAHSQGVSHGNLKAEKVFISNSGNVLITDWSKASFKNTQEQEKDLKVLGELLISLIKLCSDLDSVPAGLKAISHNLYESVKQMTEDLQAYRDGYVPKALNFYLIRSAFQVFKRNPLFCLFLILSASFIIFLSIWFFDNLKERQLIIDANLVEAEKKKTAANLALKEFQKENELRNEISMEAAEAHAAEARTALRIGDLDKAREMASIAWQLNNKERFTMEANAHIAFIDQRYEQSIDFYKDRRKDYFEVILKLSEKYLQKAPDIDQLLSDYEKCDRKELIIYSINKLLFKKSGEEFKKKFVELVKHFNPDAEVSVDIKLLEGEMSINFSGSRNIKTLKFLQGMPIQTLDISNTGITEIDLQAVPHLKKVIFNKGQDFKTLKTVEKVLQ